MNDIRIEDLQTKIDSLEEKLKFYEGIIEEVGEDHKMHEYWLTASRDELIEALQFQGMMTKCLLDEQEKRVDVQIKLSKLASSITNLFNSLPQDSFNNARTAIEDFIADMIHEDKIELSQMGCVCCDWYCHTCNKSFADQDCDSMFNENAPACPECSGVLIDSWNIFNATRIGRHLDSE